MPVVPVDVAVLVTVAEAVVGVGVESAPVLVVAWVFFGYSSKKLTRTFSFLDWSWS